jgi:Mannosyltransferase (PIG-V)
MSTARHPAIRIAVYALAFRVVSAVIAFLANVVFPLYQREGFTMFGRASPFWDPFTRWDSGWFFGIARNGYQYVEGGRNNLAYFPVYPLLMRHVGRLFGRTSADVYLGGIVVSWTAFILAMIGLYYLARLDVPARRAERAVLLTAVFPFAFFFGVVYTESLFLLFTVASFYAFRTRRWVWGGLAGAVATATRVNGILMLPALAWIAWRTAADRRDRLMAVVGLVLVTSGVGLYSLYVYSLSGNPFEWAASIQRWGYYPGGAPWLAPFRLVGMLVVHPYAFLAGERMAPYDTLNGIAAVAFAASVPFVWRRFGAAYGLFMVANLWLPLSSGQYEGLGRYCSVMFPCFIWLGSLRQRAAVAGLVVIFAMLYTLCFALFVTLHPLF